VNSKLTGILNDIGYDRVDSLSKEDCARISKQLKEATADRFKELGYEFDRLDLGMAQPKTELSTGRAIKEVGLGATVEAIAKGDTLDSWTPSVKTS
jgi:hypothetical protein